jgi:hypothetical protein
MTGLLVALMERLLIGGHARYVRGGERLKELVARPWRARRGSTSRRAAASSTPGIP